MELWELVQQHGCRRVSVIGMVKNAGKTVTLNRLIRQANQTSVSLGVTSSGRDGEREDVVWRNAKPAIWVPKGTLIATAKSLLPLATAKLRVVQETGFHTPLGIVCVAKAREEGQVQLAGPSITSQLAQITKLLGDLGSDLVLIDGAMNRAASAAPSTCDGLILASGASLDPSLEVVVQQTQTRLEQLSIPEVTGSKAFVRAPGDVNFWYREGRIEALPWPSVLGYEQAIARAITPGVQGIFLRGALTDKFLTLIGCQNQGNKDFVIVVTDPTKIQVSWTIWRKFSARGGLVKVLYPLKLLALTINPWSPCGWEFDPSQFLERFRTVISEIPVFDLYQPNR